VIAHSSRLSFGDLRVRALSIPDPNKLPWRELGVDVVVESTGQFEQRAEAQRVVDEALAFALAATDPEPSDALKYVYAEES
jgi:glyceraldehyde-3-phosphate dehydrogenase/erythrose-4-phosphate dehydrogenase